VRGLLGDWQSCRHGAPPRIRRYGKQREYVKKGNNSMAMTFEQVIETIRQFPAEQQEMLIDLIRGWRTETRRREIARDAQESLAAFRSGQLEPQSAQAVVTELRQSLEGQE